MTKKLFSLIVAFAWATTMMAQNIAVVSPTGDTSLYKTLQEAVDGAEDGSVVYLPGGSFSGCNIVKTLTILGIGYKSKTDNNYEHTHITGDLMFKSGSGGSALMGCYVSGTVRVANDGTPVNNVMIKYNNVGSIYVHSSSSGTIINQNIVRDVIYGNSDKNSGVCVTNNITKVIRLKEKLK